MLISVLVAAKIELPQLKCRSTETLVKRNSGIDAVLG
jgi:hypothetical protein